MGCGELGKQVQNMSVLLVDDVEDIRLWLRARLGHQFPMIKFQEAASGQEASVRLRETHFDLVISDAEMDDGTGYWLQLFMRENCPSTPLIIFTGNPDMFPGSLDGTLSAIVTKPDVMKLIAEIQKRRTNNIWEKQTS